MAKASHRASSWHGRADPRLLHADSRHFPNPDRHGDTAEPKAAGEHSALTKSRPDSEHDRRLRGRLRCCAHSTECSTTRERHHRHDGRRSSGCHGTGNRHRRNRGPGARCGLSNQHQRAERHARKCTDHRSTGGRMAGESTRLHAIGFGGSHEGTSDRSSEQWRPSETRQCLGGDHTTEREYNAATQIAMFYFQQLFNTAMSGIDSGGATAGAVQVAQYILLASLLFGIYEAWARGGDTHFLGATAVRFFAVGLVMVNYGTVFRDVNGMFNNVASFINTSTAGGGAGFGKGMADLSTYWNNNNGIQALWGLITGALSGVLESLLLLVGYIVFPITYALFSLFYTLYGSILYVVGPFVLALYLACGFGVMARKYLVNLMIFNAWGLLYSIFGALMAAINMNSVNTVLNSGNFVGAFNGVMGSLLLGLASILLSLCIALIPFLAKRVVEGDVGSTMTAVISTTMLAVRGAGSLFKGGGGAGGGGGGGGNSGSSGGGGSGSSGGSGSGGGGAAAAA